MLITFETDSKTFKSDLSKPLNIAIPLQFDGAQPNAYDVQRAISTPYKAGDIIGDTRQGGSVNFEQITFIPHCNGTHTECVGHITNERISVNDCLQDSFILADLVSVLPEKASETNETYSVELNNDDLLITRKGLEICRLQIKDYKSEGLIIRTLPNDEGKLSKTYLNDIPPFFSNEAINFINELNISHLLVDMPSIDRIFDEGNLTNHRTFWNIKRGSFEISAETFVNRTITELIYVPNEIKDGKYLLNLQITPFQADASPSRPILFELFD
ncbi:MAG TPA: cyclase family protein [Pyrinomonadaceae bacterium]|nr:cyclase family protein [Pyrinomonadaceae bacterium]